MKEFRQCETKSSTFFFHADGKAPRYESDGAGGGGAGVRVARVVRGLGVLDELEAKAALDAEVAVRD